MEVKLSKRMSALAALVTPGMRLADVGTDHGYIPVWLCQRNVVPSAIAMDINPGPLKRAEEHITAYGLTDRIETRLCDGLEKLHANETDVILIAGMGGGLIQKILSEGRHALDGVKELILQPQSEIGGTRQYLREHGFWIIDEDMVEEDGKYYPMMKAVPERAVSERAFPPDTEDMLKLCDAFGPVLLNRKHPVLMRWLERERTITESILSRLTAQLNKAAEDSPENDNNEQSERLLLRQKELLEKKEMIQKAIELMRRK